MREMALTKPRNRQRCDFILADKLQFDVLARDAPYGSFGRRCGGHDFSCRLFLAISIAPIIMPVKNASGHVTSARLSMTHSPTLCGFLAYIAPAHAIARPTRKYHRRNSE